ncbi:MFS transporter [Methanocella arvoryzae]|uniref:Multidrug resistance transport system, permease component n=1 Tax=Methanocella arvoryzae (strain DSM 22066 / NBRC 105507 / MRE50) TaxID=351160 RepID=Q0W4M4_METAR|nr:MFS transporter [Methanocella arvoryzae]CAJ36669.1 multidrug resistance transport system, permease component [Methanocella arvoryzae MRE50]
MQQAQQEQIPEQVYRNRYKIMLVVLPSIFMSVIDGTVTNIALPTITSYFNVDVALSQWVITGYLLTITSLLLVFGKISERTGKIPIFIAGFAIFTVSSLACGLAPNLPVLIGCRVLQAVGGAMVFSISGAILFQAFPVKERGRAMGYIGSTVAIGGIMGPVVGGFLVSTLGWQYIFLINVPIGVVVLLAALAYLRMPETKYEEAGFDWAGTGALVTAMTSLVLCLGQLADTAAITPPIVALAAIFAVSLTAFVWIESRARSPILDLEVFRIKNFTLPCLSMLLFFVGSFTVTIVGPFYFEGVMGFTPAQVGMFFLINPIIMMIGAPIGGWLYDKHHSKYYSTAGMLIITAAMFLYAYAAYIASIPAIIAGMVLLGIGGALFQSPNNTELMSALPRQKLGIASSVSSTVRNLGFTLGTSFAVLLLTVQFSLAGYHGQILEADHSLLIPVVAITMAAGGVICLMSAIASLLRNV